MSPSHTLQQATADQLQAAFASAGAILSKEFFEDAAQQVVMDLYHSFPTSIVLARAYVTVPMCALPSRNADWVRDLASAKGIAEEITPTTEVLSLVGSAGRLPDWNDRRASRGHVGVPMTSAAFIDAIPMMARLMASLGGDLSWIDRNDTAHLMSKLGTVAGTFYVADAATETDARGRLVIPAADFVAEHGVKCVFALGGAFASGHLLIVLLFCNEHIDRSVVDAMRAPFLRVKSAVAPLLRSVFRDGNVDGRRVLPVSLRPPAPVVGELAALNRAYLTLESELESRTRSLRITLDSTGDGLMVVDFDGTIFGETSAMLARWYGPHTSLTNAAEYLFGADDRAAAAFSLGLESMADDELPFELVVDGMPRSVERSGATYDITYRQVYEKDRFARVLVVVRDITAMLAAERAEALTRETHAAVKMLLRDRGDFRRFTEDSAERIARIGAAANGTTLRRELHTLKGNVGLYGLESFASEIHAIEGELTDDQPSLSPGQLEIVGAGWARCLSLLGEFLDQEVRPCVEITTDEYQDFIERLRVGAPPAELAALARSWKNEPTSRGLAKLAAQAQLLAARLSKEVDIFVDDGGVRVPAEIARLCTSSLVHVVRNAIDHGIEAPEERRRAGKPTPARLSLKSFVRDGSFVVEISDDGRGVSWQALRERADAAGLPARDTADLVELLFMDGVSTREEATETSGRGVGMAALRDECRAAGGVVELESHSGRGTTVRVRVPLATAA